MWTPEQSVWTGKHSSNVYGCYELSFCQCYMLELYYRLEFMTAAFIFYPSLQHEMSTIAENVSNLFKMSIVNVRFCCQSFTIKE